MTPNFAFLVSQDTLRLLMNIGDSWAELGQVATSQPDVAQRLEDMRTKAQAHCDGDMLIKLVIPNDYIRYMSLPGKQHHNDILVALEGATPYAVSDLVVDFEYADSHTNVAAVAQEFLDEIENFAVDHGLAPVCFTAIAREGSFEREISFGLAKGAARLIDDPDHLAASHAPIVIVPFADGMRALSATPSPQPQPPIEDMIQNDHEPNDIPAAASPMDASAAQHDPSDADTLPASDDGFLPFTPAQKPPAQDELPLDLDAPQGNVLLKHKGQAAPINLDLAPSEDALPEISFSSRSKPAPRSSSPSAEKPKDAPTALTDAKIAPEQPVFQHKSRPAAPTQTGETHKKSAPDLTEGATRRTGRATQSTQTPTDAKAFTTPQARAVQSFSMTNAKEKSTAIFAPLLSAENRKRGAIVAAGITGIAAVLCVSIFALWGDSPSNETPDIPQDIIAPADDTSNTTEVVQEPVTSTNTDAETNAAQPAEIAAEPAAEQPQEPAPVVRPPAQPSAPLSQEDAQRIYAATGVWQRAPSEPTGIMAQDAPSAQPPKTDPITHNDTVALAAQNPGEDLRPLTPPPPPDRNSDFTFDDRGFVIATPDGTRTPEGITVYKAPPAVSPPTAPGRAGPPTVPVSESATSRPPQRPASPAAQERPEPSSENTDLGSDVGVPQALPPEADQQIRDENGRVLRIYQRAPEIGPPQRPAPQPVPTESTGETGEETPPQSAPTQTGARVPPRVEIMTASAAVTSQDPSAETAEGAELSANLTPPPRPAGGVGVSALLAAENTTDPVPLPHVRPDNLAPRDNAAVEQAIALAALQPDASPQAAPAPLSPYAIARSARPEGRPRNIGRIVSRANAAEERQASRSTQVATAQPARPSGPTGQTVAARATEQNVINLREINLIGVYGSSSNRRALVRLRNGRLVKVSVGQRLDGGRVRAISGDALQYTKGGRNITLQIPS